MLESMYEALLVEPAFTPPAGMTFAAFADTLIAEGLPKAARSKVYLRFERIAQGRGAGQVAVLATWRARSLAGGIVDHLRLMFPDDAAALRADCKAQGLRIIDHA